MSSATQATRVPDFGGGYGWTGDDTAATPSQPAAAQPLDQTDQSEPAAQPAASNQGPAAPAQTPSDRGTGIRNLPDTGESDGEAALLAGLALLGGTAALAAGRRKKKEKVDK